MKDFKDHYTQKMWEHAAASHARYKAWLENPLLVKIHDRARQFIAELESKYPQLKK